MFVPDSIRLLFIIICCVLIAFLAVLSVFMYKKQNEYRLYIEIPIVTGVYSIIAYCLFLASRNHFYAVLFDSLYFVGTDWLALFMLLFAIQYTEIGVGHRKKIIGILGSLCLIDSLDLIFNNFTHSMFDLVERNNAFWGWYWANDFYFLHYLHLALCYVMVGATFVLFVISLINSPQIYKVKFRGILISYIVVIIANGICYTLNLPYDISVILYGILAAFIGFYSTYTFPHSLVNTSLKNINETISDGVLYFNDKGNCIYANKVAKMVFSENGVYNVKLANDFRQMCIKNNLSGLSDEIDTFIVNTEPRRFRIEFNREIYKDTEAGSYLKLIDVTVAVNIREREHYTAIHDELTGLFNRVGYFEEVDNYIKKNGSDGKLMITSNIKDFKLVNDLFGEKTGDEVLLGQAQIIVQHMHSTSFCGRIADDKFSIFIDKEYAQAERFTNFVKELQTITEDSMYKMELSIGVYDPEGRIESAQSMYNKTLMAIANSSDSFGKIFNYYDSQLMEKLLNEKNIIEEFEVALDKNQIEMYLQPVINTRSNVLGAEALCRWRHPMRGFMMPSDFLDILEKEGLIYQLDEYIWNLAAKKIHEWNSKGCLDCYISVNVSVKDFFYSDIYKTFTRLVDEYDIAPSSLHIEITESVLMSDFEKAFSLSKKLQKAGFVIAIDNFGTGYSSLNMLKDFRPQIIKIDMSFLQRGNKKERSKIILESIVNMTRSLNIETVGEGVEQKSHYDILRSLNCNIFQGMYLSEPLSIREYEDKFVKYFYS